MLGAYLGILTREVSNDSDINISSVTSKLLQITVHLQYV